MKHKIESEFVNKDGSWSKLSLKISSDAQKTIKRLLKKYEGKISISSLELIVIKSLQHEVMLANILSLPIMNEKKAKK